VLTRGSNGQVDSHPRVCFYLYTLLTVRVRGQNKTNTTVSQSTEECEFVKTWFWTDSEHNMPFLSFEARCLMSDSCVALTVVLFRHAPRCCAYICAKQSVYSDTVTEWNISTNLYSSKHTQKHPFWTTSKSFIWSTPRTDETESRWEGN